MCVICQHEVLYIETHDSRSHMWTSATMMKYLSFFSTELPAKRQELNLDATSRGLLICDKASVHHANIFERARKQWERENNCLIIHGKTDDLVSIPGGFGATGGPNDGWHNHWHAFRRSFMRVAIGQGASQKVRTALDKMEMSIDKKISLGGGFSLLRSSKDKKLERSSVIPAGHRHVVYF